MRDLLELPVKQITRQRFSLSPFLTYILVGCKFEYTELKTLNKLEEAHL